MKVLELDQDYYKDLNIKCISEIICNNKFFDITIDGFTNGIEDQNITIKKSNTKNKVILKSNGFYGDLIIDENKINIKCKYGLYFIAIKKYTNPVGWSEEKFYKLDNNNYLNKHSLKNVLNEHISNKKECFKSSLTTNFLKKSKSKLINDSYKDLSDIFLEMFELYKDFTFKSYSDFYKSLCN